MNQRPTNEERANAWDQLYESIESALDSLLKVSDQVRPTRDGGYPTIGVDSQVVRGHLEKAYEDLWAARRFVAQEAYTHRYRANKERDNTPV